MRVYLNSDEGIQDASSLRIFRKFNSPIIHLHFNSIANNKKITLSQHIIITSYHFLCKLLQLTNIISLRLVPCFVRSFVCCGDSSIRLLSRSIPLIQFNSIRLDSIKFIREALLYFIPFDQS